MNDLRTLTPVELSEVWINEPEYFTPWLAQAENLTLLGQALGMELELDAQEIDVGRFRADLRCRNIVDDSWVLIENQLEATDHRHVGQILTYAAGLDAHTVIWIAKTFRQEYRAMLEWQNRITHDPYRFFGVEVKVWQIGDSDRAVQFEVVSSPNDWTRNVSRSTERAATQALSDTQQSHLKFWTGLREYMVGKGSSVIFPDVRTRRYMVLGIGRASFSLMVWRAHTRSEIGIWLYVRGDNANAYFGLLEEQQAAIHNEFGETLEWVELSGGQTKRICLAKVDTDPLDENDWPQQYEWFTSKLELFDTVFRDRIRDLNAEDWIDHEDDSE